MSIKLNTRQNGDVHVIDVTGPITIDEGASALRDEVRDLVSQGRKKILLNLKEVPRIDSVGLGVLVGCYANVVNNDGQIKTLNLSAKVKDLFQVTKLYTIFDVHEDETAAVRSFADDGRFTPKDCSPDFHDRHCGR